MLGRARDRTRSRPQGFRQRNFAHCVVRVLISVQSNPNRFTTTSHLRVSASAISWPFPIDRRLDQLLDVENDARANTRRYELAAALIATAPEDGDALLALLIAWRTSRVRDVVIGVKDAAQVIELPRHPPGRRRAGS